MHCESEGSHTGFATEQSVLVRQPTQMSAPLHFGVAAGQSVSCRQFTHWFDTVSQTGASGFGQSVLSAQITHDPCFMPGAVSQAGPLRLPTQSAFVWHGWHVWLVVSHLGVMPLQSALDSHATHVPEGKSQMRFGMPVLLSAPASAPPLEPASALLVHCVVLVDEHCPHAPQTSHAGVAPLQSASDAQGSQIPSASQMGVSPPQSLGARHCTQVLLALQRGVAAGQSPLLAQITQAPWFEAGGNTHTGPVAEPTQSVLLWQGPQVSVLVLQMGVVAPQSVFARQSTHLLTGVSHTGVAAGQSALVTQFTQMPDASQAGVGVLHAESPSQVQGIPSVLTSSS